MKKIFFVTVFAIAFALSSNAQKYAVIDTKYILSKMPEYIDADKKLQQISEQWQKDIDNLQAQLNTMYKNYDAEQYMLSDDLKKKREDELFNKEKEIFSTHKFEQLLKHQYNNQDNLFINEKQKE